jgi:hypothetical protein
MANSKQILVKESEEELRKHKIKQPAHLKKRIEMLLILKKSEISFWLSVITHNWIKSLIFDKKAMNLFNFTANFGSDESCRLHFKEERDKIGVQCKCGSKEHFWIKSRWSYECKKCRSRISLRSGTIMQSSNLSFLIWYKTMFLLTATKKGFSSKEIQKQLGLKRY